MQNQKKEEVNINEKDRSDCFIVAAGRFVHHWHEWPQ